MKRATKQYGGLSSETLAKESDYVQPIDIDQYHYEVESKMESITNESDSNDPEEMICQSATGSSETSCLLKPTNDVKDIKGKKNVGSPIVILVDFLCPISLELIRDPVIVSTGQVCRI